jgi:hypothetical protein
MKEDIHKYKARLAIFAGNPLNAKGEYITLQNAQEVLEKAVIEVHNNALKMVEEEAPESSDTEYMDEFEMGLKKGRNSMKKDFINNIQKLKI